MKIDIVFSGQLPGHNRKLLLSCRFHKVISIRVSFESFQSEELVQFGFRITAENILEENPEYYDQMYFFHGDGGFSGWAIQRSLSESLYGPRPNDSELGSEKKTVKRRRDKKIRQRKVSQLCIDLFKRKYIFLPVVEKGHWMLLVVCNLSLAVERFMQGETRRTIAEKEQLFVEREALKREISRLDQNIESMKADEMAKLALEKSETDIETKAEDENDDVKRTEVEDVEKAEGDNTEVEKADVKEAEFKDAEVEKAEDKNSKDEVADDTRIEENVAEKCDEKIEEKSDETKAAEEEKMETNEPAKDEAEPKEMADEPSSKECDEKVEKSQEDVMSESGVKVEDETEENVNHQSDSDDSEMSNSVSTSERNITYSG